MLEVFRTVANHFSLSQLPLERELRDVGRILLKGDNITLIQSVQ